MGVHVRNPAAWWKQVQLDMTELERRTYTAMISYLTARTAAVRMERLYILQSLEKSATHALRNFLSLARKEAVANPAEWTRYAHMVLNLQETIYQRRCAYLEPMWAEDRQAGCGKSKSPAYCALVMAQRLLIAVQDARHRLDFF